jgi:hypothetical protein
MVGEAPAAERARRIPTLRGWLMPDDLFPTYSSRAKAVAAANAEIGPGAELGKDFAVDSEREGGRLRWHWMRLERTAAAIKMTRLQKRHLPSVKLAAKSAAKAPPAAEPVAEAQPAPPEPAPPPPPTQLEDGIYFGLDEDLYHAQKRLGSTDMKRLASSGPEYWWFSHRNPARKDNDTAARLFGRAVHKVVLEGRESFDRTYATLPEGCLETDKDLARWLTWRGITKLPRTKAEKIIVIQTIAPDVLIRDAIEAEAEAKGIVMLPAELYDRMVVSGAMISKNPELVTAFQNGYAEVSVLYTDDGGLKRKARFDYLKMRGIGDLKTVSAVKRSFTESCIRAIAEFRYDIQAADYMHARLAMAGLHRAGRVFGEHDAAWLAKCVAVEEFGWQWVFLQSNFAPLTWTKTLSPKNPILDVAAAELAVAANRYREFEARFGDDMWVLAEQASELTQDEMPGWWARR